MATTAVAAALTEILAALAAIPTPHEGLRDFARLNLNPATLLEVRASLEAYDRRLLKLQAAHGTLEQLLADGYPDLPPRDISAAALEDLRANARSVEAALAQFTSPAPATRLNLSVGAIEPKAP